MTQCKKKSPVFVSRPHFYLADETYLRQFQYGLSPDPDRHNSVFWMEPMSSIPLKVDIKLQLNVQLRKVEGIEYLFKDLPEVIFPVLWFESLSEIGEDMAGPIHMLVMLPTFIQLFAVMSLIASCVGALLTCYLLRQQRSSSSLETVIRKSLKYQYSPVSVSVMENK